MMQERLDLVRETMERVITIERTQGGFTARHAAALPAAAETRLAYPPAAASRSPGEATSEEWMRGYVAWELTLPEQIGPNGDARFGRLGPG